MRKSNKFTTSVNATSMESYFIMPAFYIGFCHYQLHQYSSDQSCKTGFSKVESEFLLNLDTVMKKK